MTTYPKSDAAAIEALRNKGYKATPQRIAICRIALNSRAHPSAQQVYDEVKKIHPTISLATVYKTLEVLRDLDLMQEINFPKGQARSDSYMNLLKMRHHHRPRRYNCKRNNKEGCSNHKIQANRATRRCIWRLSKVQWHQIGRKN